MKLTKFDAQVLDQISDDYYGLWEVCDYVNGLMPDAGRGAATAKCKASVAEYFSEGFHRGICRPDDRQRLSPLGESRGGQNASPRQFMAKTKRTWGGSGGFDYRSRRRCCGERFIQLTFKLYHYRFSTPLDITLRDHRVRHHQSASGPEGL
jgi:hypothetical protein